MDLSRKERAFERRFRRQLSLWPEHNPWPGVLLCVLLAFLAAYLHTLPFAPFTLADGQQPVSSVLLALLLGMLLRNLVPGMVRLKAGADSVVRKWLPVGIVLLGARLDFYVLVEVAVQIMVGAAVLIALIILLTRLLSHWCQVPEKLGLLIGIGTAICGSSAIVAAAPVVEATEEEMAYSIGVINILGVATMLLFPLLGQLLALDAAVYGAWCGLSIHATPQVIATGFAHPIDGQAAGETATIVKLVRISLLGPALFILGAWFAHRQRQHSAYVDQPVRYSKLVPGFVVLFLAMALLRTLGFLPEVTFHMSERWLFGAGDQHVDLARLLSQTGTWVITAAIAGVGLATDVRAMKSGGMRPLLLGLLAALGVALLGLLVASL